MAGYGEQVADKAIEETARKIRRIYTQAAKELRGKMVAFNKRFAKKTETMRGKLESGEITKAAYESWLRGQVFMGRQWAQKADQAIRVMQDANTEAKIMIDNGKLNVFAENYNYTAYDIDKHAGAFLNFNLYDEDTVEKLIREKPKMLPEWKIDEKKDYKWNRQKVENSITQGIIQGEGIDQITDRLVDSLCTQNENRMRTFARTSMTGAQNAGRQASMEDAEDMGIKLKKRWLATLDNRTRDLHQELDGQTVDVDEPFEVDLNGEHYEIRYPGDPNAEPEMVYNCRCTMIEIYEGIDRKSVRRDMDNNEVEDMTYKEWKAMREGGQEGGQRSILGEKINVIVQGKDITETWERRENEFKFGIQDVIDAQGYDGIPRVLPQDEFDKAVEESHFIAQRTYSAPDKDILDAYRDMLYNGEWYVDCSVGGAQYGQGMYCAADYTGTLSDGIKGEMEHYRNLNTARGNGYNYTETITLTPDAKIITFDDAFELRNNYNDSATEREREQARKLIFEMHGITGDAAKDYGEMLDYYIGKEDFTREAYRANKALKEKYGLLNEEESTIGGLFKEITKKQEELRKGRLTDVGSIAAAYGYDAINAEGHGLSGSYTVILNRTKCIFLGGEK